MSQDEHATTPVSLEGDIDANGLTVARTLLVVASLAIVVGACSSGLTSETEYVENLNALVVSAGSDLVASSAAFEQIADPTSEDFINFVEQQLITEYEVRDQFGALDPPDSLNDVNQIMVDTLARIIAAAEGLVDAADTDLSLEEIQKTPEFAEYQGINADSDSMCLEVEAKLNDFSTKPVSDAPWLPNLQRTVRALLDCDDSGAG